MASIRPWPTRCGRPGEFQVYDIVFRRPIYKDGKPVDPGYVTVFVNGVLVQDHTPCSKAAPGTWAAPGRARSRREGPAPAAGPRQPHPLPQHLVPRTAAPRHRGRHRRLPDHRSHHGQAQGNRRDAAGGRGQTGQPGQSAARNAAADGVAGVFPGRPPPWRRWNRWPRQYAETVKSLPADKLAAKKDEVKGLRDNFRFLTRFKALPDTFGPKAELEQIIKDQGWDKKKP